MRIVVAMDSFKESMSAFEACKAVSKGFLSVYPDAHIDMVPMADGGEGTVQSLSDATGGRIIRCDVADPLGEVIEGFYAITGDGSTAIIEMAAASGLELIPVEKRNPLLTSTRGTGDLILHALKNGVTKVILGIGGSATNDGGMGMAKSLGVHFLDKRGDELLACGAALGNIYDIDLSQKNPLIDTAQFIVACDVDNPLTGEYGAAAVFGPQKGASPEMIKLLDEGLENFADIIKKKIGKDITGIAGAGAAGGLGGGCIAFLNAQLQKGIDIILETVNLEEKVKNADFVITGEGAMDFQTVYGKTPMGVAKTAKKYNKTVIALVGFKGLNYHSVYDIGIDAVFSVANGSSSLEEALIKGKENLEDLSVNLAKIIKKFI